MKEKFMNVVNKVRNADGKQVVKVAAISLGVVTGLVVAGYLIKHGASQEALTETYYDVVDTTVSTIE